MSANEQCKKEGIFLFVPDLQSTVGALRTYQESGHYRDCIHPQNAMIAACSIGRMLHNGNHGLEEVGGTHVHRHICSWIFFAFFRGIHANCLKGGGEGARLCLP